MNNETVGNPQGIPTSFKWPGVTPHQRWVLKTRRDVAAEIYGDQKLWTVINECETPPARIS